MKHKAGNLGVDLLLIDTGKNLIFDLVDFFCVLVDETIYNRVSFVVKSLLKFVKILRNGTLDIRGSCPLSIANSHHRDPSIVDAGCYRRST